MRMKKIRKTPASNSVIILGGQKIERVSLFSEKKVLSKRTHFSSPTSILPSIIIVISLSLVTSTAIIATLEK